MKSNLFRQFNSHRNNLQAASKGNGEQPRCRHNSFVPDSLQTDPHEDVLSDSIKDNANSDWDKDLIAKGSISSSRGPIKYLNSIVFG